MLNNMISMINVSAFGSLNYAKQSCHKKVYFA